MVELVLEEEGHELAQQRVAVAVGEEAAEGGEVQGADLQAEAPGDVGDALAQGAVEAEAGISGAKAGAPVGDAAPDLDAVASYLQRVRAVSEVPVCAGFGIRSAQQVSALASHAHGAVVGSALVEVLEEGGDPAAFVRSLRP